MLTLTHINWGWKYVNGILSGSAGTGDVHASELSIMVSD